MIMIDGRSASASGTASPRQATITLYGQSEPSIESSSQPAHVAPVVAAASYQTSPLAVTTASNQASTDSAKNVVHQQQTKNHKALLSFNTNRRVEFKDVIVPKRTNDSPLVRISSRSSPVMFLFKSKSTNLKVNHRHFKTKGSIKHTSSQDPPQRLVQTIRKSVIQDIRTIIAPQRKVIQEVKPVVEEINTIVHSNENKTQATTVATAVQLSTPTSTASPLQTLEASKQIENVVQQNPQVILIKTEQQPTPKVETKPLEENLVINQEASLVNKKEEPLPVLLLTQGENNELLTQFGGKVQTLESTKTQGLQRITSLVGNEQKQQHHQIQQQKPTLLLIVNRQVQILPEAVQLN